MCGKMKRVHDGAAYITNYPTVVRGRVVILPPINRIQVRRNQNMGALLMNILPERLRFLTEIGVGRRALGSLLHQRPTALRRLTSKLLRLGDQ